MQDDPLWTRCLHLPAGTCPELGSLGPQLGGASERRPELNQDLALDRLGRACLSCQFKPEEPESN